jgi:hypothetical protein
VVIELIDRADADDKARALDSMARIVLDLFEAPRELSRKGQLLLGKESISHSRPSSPPSALDLLQLKNPDSGL